MAWMKGTFIDETGPLYNEEYWHLTDANIGVLWTNVPNAKGGMRIVGTAELIQTKGSRWTKGRELFILRNWFGEIPDFVITLDALYCHESDDYTFCGTCEHELSHCGIKVNSFGEEVFDPDDNPVFALRAHDAEEFVHVVARYGVGAAAGKVAQLVQAANSRPLIGEGQMRAACGNCIR
jgi:hypothetical protein